MLHCIYANFNYPSVIFGIDAIASLYSVDSESFIEFLIFFCFFHADNSQQASVIRRNGAQQVRKIV